MKKLLPLSLALCSAFTACCSHAEALAEWTYPASDVPVLHPIEFSTTRVELGVANLKTSLIGLMDLRGAEEAGTPCFNHGEDRGIQELSPISVNGKYVRFYAICMNGVGIMTPITNSGRAYLNNLVWSGSAVDVQIDDKATLHFPKSDIPALKKRIAEVNGAL